MLCPYCNNNIACDLKMFYCICFVLCISEKYKNKNLIAFSASHITKEIQV